MCKLHKNDLYFFTLNNGTGTINNIDIRHKKVYDTNMEPYQSQTGEIVTIETEKQRLVPDIPQSVVIYHYK